jgi:hypothetical protein
MRRFTHYIALGDSMSIDDYPTCDVHGLDLPSKDPEPLGAASLLHRNQDDRWPEFRGRDLATRYPGVEFHNLAWDGAMIEDVTTDELARAGQDSPDSALLLTLTAGGNDLLDALTVERSLPQAVGEIVERYRELVETLREEFPRATLVLTTVYDPTDGTGHLPGLSEYYGRLPLQHLDHFNDYVRETTRRTQGALLADVHRHFLGHGVTAPEAERWYWRRAPTEPSARGASEIRRVWLQTLDPNASP